MTTAATTKRRIPVPPAWTKLFLGRVLLQRHVGAVPPDVPYRRFCTVRSPFSSKSIGPSTVSNWCRAGMRSSPGAPASRLSRPPAPTPERRHKRTGCNPLGSKPDARNRSTTGAASARPRGSGTSVKSVPSAPAPAMRPKSSLARLTQRPAEPIAAVACRTRHERDLGVVSANEHHGDIGRLELIDFGSIVVLPREVSLVDRFSHATMVQLLLCQLGDTLPEGRVVVEDRDLLVGPMIGQVIAGHHSLPHRRGT